MYTLKKEIIIIIINKKNTKNVKWLNSYCLGEN